MEERSKPGQLYYSAIFILGVLTAFNMFLSIGEPGSLTMILFGLATGAIGGTVLLEALKHYGAADGRELTGRARRKMALAGGVVFGAVLTPAIAMVTDTDGGFLFSVCLVVGSGLGSRVRRTLRGWIRTDPAQGPRDDFEDQNGPRMPKFAKDSTREELAAGAVMVFGLVLSAGAVLAAFAGLLAIMGR